jgi:P27 family predicted phage terminase small subunit
MGGRPRKPTAVKKLQGTLQKCRTNPAEPTPQNDLKAMTPPEYLTDSAKEIWAFALSQAPEGMLSTLDFGIFSEWAVVYDQFLTISESIKKGGTLRRETDGELVPSPLLSKLHSTITLLRGLQSDLGFTPSSRSRVVSFGKATEKTGNKFADL